MNILVPFDIQPVSERAVRATLRLFGGNEAVNVTAVHVSAGEETPAKVAASEIESLGDTYEATVSAEIRLIDHGAESKAAVRQAITEVVETDEIDLVVLGYESKSLLDRVLESDTAERMLQTHEIPVLLVP